MKKAHSFLFLLIVSMFFSCNSEKTESPILAKVGEAELSFEQVKSTLGIDSINTTNEIKRYIYRWVDNELLYQAALAEGIGSSPEIQDELRKVRRSLIINNFLEKRLGVLPEISEDRLKKHYSEYKNDFIRDQTEYRYFFVICKDRSFAQKVLRDIRKDVTFEEIIKNNYPEKIVNSVWDSGYVPLEQVIPEIRRRIQKLKPGNSFGPVASSSGHVVFKLQEKYQEGTERSFEQVKDLIERRLEEDWYREHYQKLLGSLRNKKSVIVNLDGTEKPVSADTNQTQNRGL